MQNVAAQCATALQQCIVHLVTAKHVCMYSYVHMYLLCFVFRKNPRGIPASIDSSAWNLAENHSGIVRKITARLRGFPRPPAPESRGIRRKNVSYPCQVPYKRQLQDLLCLCVWGYVKYLHVVSPGNAVMWLNLTPTDSLRVE